MNLNELKNTLMKLELSTWRIFCPTNGLGNSGECVILRLDIQTPKKIGFAKEHLEGVKEKVLGDFDEAA
jgi:hypothetical protein